MTEFFKKKTSPTLSMLPGKTLSPLDMLPHRTTVEKLIELALMGVPKAPQEIRESLSELASSIEGVDVDDVNVLVFGGGTGLSTVVGGDSRNPDWPSSPFQGLKDIFPKTKAVVCVTDDGGSTGELLKDLPMIGLGDLRHVLLSALRKETIQGSYSLNSKDSLDLVHKLYALFNFRFDRTPSDADELIESTGIDFSTLPHYLADELTGLVNNLFDVSIFASVLQRPQCLGNLLLASAIYQQNDFQPNFSPDAIKDGINLIAQLVGVEQDHVLPCTITPCQLKILYSNGVLITGEHKSSQTKRGCPVDHAFVEFSGTPQIMPEIFTAIQQADIIIFAPGSLYTSIVPVMQVPGLSEAVRKNRDALKILVSNIWVQAGETDIAFDAPERRYYVSDLVKAYHRNIPGGVKDLFQIIISLGMRDISGNVIQRYAVEGKTPIFLDRGNVWNMGFTSIEANIFSRQALRDRTLKHDPVSFARAVKTVWAGKKFIIYAENDKEHTLGAGAADYCIEKGEVASDRFRLVAQRLERLSISERGRIADILWKHKDIPVAHLDYISGVELVDVKLWRRCQKWDNVFSFYDPQDRLIKIRKDMLGLPEKFELAFLVALGQSLLGNYAQKKRMEPLLQDGNHLGRVYTIQVRDTTTLSCFFSRPELERFLGLAKMNKLQPDSDVFVRLLSGEEGFTPSGLLMGLIYAWYLDNLLASHVEYKMSITKMPISDLVPEQVKTMQRRHATIEFFRREVFRQDRSAFDVGLQSEVKC